MDALVAEGPWEGRDEWYTSLMSDETMLEIQDNGYTGLTTMMRAVEPGSWRDRLIKMLSSPHKAVRSAAVRNLQSQGFDKEIVEALLPWISDPNWAKPSRDDERNSLIEALGKIDIPQAVPLLISVLSSEEENVAVAAKALGEKKDSRAIPALRAALANGSGTGRSEIIGALVATGGFTDREQLAALESFLEMTATDAGRQKFYELKEELENRYEYDEEEEEEGPKPSPPSAKPDKTEASKLPIEVSIGEFVSKITEPGETLAVLAVAREKELRRRNSDIAESFAKVINGWKGAAVYLEWLRKLKSGEADIDTLLEILAAREDIRVKLPVEAATLRSSAGSFRGIGACINKDEQEFLSIIATGDPESQTAALACARLLRIKLPVDGVAALLAAKPPGVRLAAERYLETEDSVLARTTLIKHRPGQATILGARLAFVPDNVRSVYRSESLDRLFETVNAAPFWNAFTGMKKFEERLRAEFNENRDLLSIYAKVTEGDAGHHVIRVFKDKVRFTVYEDPARYREGELSEKEFKDFYSFLLSEKIDELGPVVGDCHHGCPSGEFVMLGRDGGRRNFYYAYQPPEKLGKLNEFYEAFAKKELRLNYPLADSIKGLEVILADDKFPVHAVWKKDGDLRFLISDVEMREQIDREHSQKAEQEMEAVADEDDRSRMAEIYEIQRKRREESVGAEFSWRTLDRGKIGPATAKPEMFPFELKDSKFLTEFTGRWNTSGIGQRTGSLDFAVAAMPYGDGGLFKVKPGDEDPVKIKDGAYAQPLVTPDGKWVVAAKYEGEETDALSLVRIDLANGKETRISVPPADGLIPLRFLEGRKKVLVYRGPARFNRYGGPVIQERDDEPTEREPTASNKPNMTPKVPEYYLVNVATGAVDKVSGVFAPLEEAGYRPLQPATEPGESWAVVYDAPSKTSRIGLYSESKFTFRPIVALPGLKVSTMNTWIDEKENKAYFVYNGHLLAVPLEQ